MPAPLAEHRHWGTWASVVAVHGLSCSRACGIILDQGWNLCSLHWQVDSYPVDHQGSSSDRDISLKLGFQLVRLKELTYLGVGGKKRYQIGRRRLSPRSPLEREVAAGPIQAPFLAHQLCPVLSGAALWGDR